MWTLFGLGNPGSEYEGTRHNIGYDVLDEAADRYSISFGGGGRHYVSGDGVIGSTPVRLVKPTRYMNRSGLAWRELSQTESLQPENTLIIFDEIHLPLGRMRIRPRGGPGGHNGLASILDAVGHEDVKRIRLGIGGSDENWVDHVLSKFLSDEIEIVNRILKAAVDAIEVVLTEGVENAMNRFNGRTV